MRFLLDAHLPRQLAHLLAYRGHNARHTLDLPAQNRSKDSELNTCTVREKRVLLSRDSDFIEALMISEKPWKLLYINTGNITNKDLQALIADNLDSLVAFLEENRFVELTRETIIVHR